MIKWLKNVTLLLVMLLGSMPAGAVISCSMMATSVDVMHPIQGKVTATGQITLTCTRSSDEPSSTYDYWVGITPTGTDRRVYRYGGDITAANWLNIDIFKGTTTTNWSALNNGRVSGTLTFTSLTQSISLPYTLQVSSQNGKNAGIYSNTFVASLQATNSGPVVATTTFSPTASVPTLCFIGQVPSGTSAPGAVSPSGINLQYTSFEPSTSASMNFTVDCTLNTPYTLSLSPSDGVLLGLMYSLRFSNSGTTIDKTGNGQAQGETITATITGGQAGTCATPTCVDTQTVVITATY